MQIWGGTWFEVKDLIHETKRRGHDNHLVSWQWFSETHLSAGTENAENTAHGFRRISVDIWKLKQTPLDYLGAKSKGMYYLGRWEESDICPRHGSWVLQATQEFIVPSLRIKHNLRNVQGKMLSSGRLLRERPKPRDFSCQQDELLSQPGTHSQRHHFNIWKKSSSVSR